VNVVCHWCDIVLNMHAPTEKTGDTEESFLRELDR